MDNLLSLLNRRVRVVVMWMVILLFLIISRLRLGVEFAVTNGIIEILCISFIANLNRLVLLPHLLYKGRTILYPTVSILIVVAITSALTRLDVNYISQLANRPPITESIFESDRIKTMLINSKYAMQCLLSLFISTIVASAEKGRKSKELWEQMKQEKLELELKFLKTQINPHFVFNALNNVYAKVYMREEDAPDSILKLSDMFRYILDDCSSETVHIEKEIDYIMNYIDFIKMKSDNSSNIAINRDISNPRASIAPIIFLPLVENCFKHSNIDRDSNGFIKIDIIEREGVVELKCINSIYSSSQKTKGTGIGLKNVQKRLNIVYPDQHTFDYLNSGNEFSVNLKINVK